MLHKNILKIRQEIVECILECEVEQGALINKISNLPDDEVLELYIEHTFDSEWRGDLIKQLEEKAQ
ncbi:hypothetical protein ACIQZG_22105 [Lysinibacillus sp. NPDC096418]|uniref:hypothetical protein n=1 Tax=Lysinibacillus sp. NPDC096418 TaxID=3364138 RepID=UPI00382AD235